MSFLVLLLAVWVEKFSAGRQRIQQDGGWLRQLARVEAAPSLQASPWLSLVLLVLVPVLLLGVLLLLLKSVAYGWLALPVHLLVLIYGLGRGDVLAALGPFRDAWRRDDTEAAYLVAARALGAGAGRIIRKHILPNCMSVIFISTALQIPSAIFTESFLSFLGIGVSAPMPSLGSLASTAIDGLQSYPYRLFAPAIAISVVILSFNLFGDGLRDAFDPKLKN